VASRSVRFTAAVSAAVGVKRASVVSRQRAGILPQRLDEQQKGVQRVLVRVVEQAVGHQIAPPRAVAVEAVEADPAAGPGQVGHHGRRPGEELEVDHGVDPLAAGPEDAAEDAAEGPHRAPLRHRDHVLGGHEVERVEDRPVLLEDHEEDVVAADPVDHGLERRVGDHRRPLLHELEHEHPADRAVWPPPVEQPPPQREHRAGRDAEPLVDEADGRGVHAATRVPSPPPRDYRKVSRAAEGSSSSTGTSDSMTCSM
jgi:hypothetical protein